MGEKPTAQNRCRGYPLPQRLYWYGVDGKLLGETDGGSVNIQWIYFDGRRISKFNMAPTGPWGADFYDDAIGSLRLETDGYGNPNCRSDYYPFGEPVGSGCSLYESFQYAGLYTDAGQEDGGYSATRRRYSNIYNRWFSPDPGGMAAASLSNPQTWNMYAYAGDNPTTNNDPSGEKYRVCQTDENGDSTNCASISDEQFGNLESDNENTLTFEGNGNILQNGTLIGTYKQTSVDLNPFALEALPLAGQWASTSIRNAAITMGINGALAGAGAAIGAGIDWLTASEETGTPAEINWGQQEKHFEGHNSYIPGRSTLTANPEELAQEAGTGTPANSVPRGAPGFKERVDFGKVIGTYRDPVTGFSAPTTKGIIVYGKGGIHIIPARP